MVAIAMAPLLLALCLEVYLLAYVILHRQLLSLAVAGILLIIFASLWFGFPFLMRREGALFAKKKMDRCYESYGCGRKPSSSER
jgi:hypothetical protein